MGFRVTILCFAGLLLAAAPAPVRNKQAQSPATPARVKTPARLLALHPEFSAECVHLGCNVKAPDKVIQTRNVSSVFEYVRRSCCSIHGGICGCTGGEAVCCDGSLTTSCGCD